MKQASTLTRRLAEAQELHAACALREAESAPLLFRLYTESFDNLRDYTQHYFKGATFLHGIGLWEGCTENVTIIEVVGTLDDLQNVVFLAGDIREANHQSSVLVTWQRLDGRLDVQS